MSSQRSSNKPSYAQLSGKTKKKTSKKSDVPTVESIPDSDPRVPSDSENDCKSCKVLSNLVRTLLDKQSTLEKEVQSLKEIVGNDSDLAIKHAALEKEMGELKSSLASDSAPQNSGEELHDMKAKLKEMEKKVEDRTNRQLRKTLVFRNIPEGANEKLWTDITDLLSQKIADLLKIDPDEAEYMIDRCHRGGNSQYYKDKNKTRPIYAAMMRWTDCEDIVKKALIVMYQIRPMMTSMVMRIL